MNGHQPSQVTRLLKQAEGDDQAATDDLLPWVYQELKRVAQMQINAERSDPTLTATALVHEAYLWLVGAEPQLPWSGKTHSYYSAGSSEAGADDPSPSMSSIWRIRMILRKSCRSTNFNDVRHDWISTAHHILPTEGIRGHDIFLDN